MSPGPDTASKRAKGIYETPKKFRVEKTGEISRNLPLSRFSSLGSKLTCHHVSTGQFRCRICVSQFRCSAMAHFSLVETEACKWPRSSGLAEPCLQTSLCILRSDPSFLAFILPFHKNKPNARLRSVWLCMGFGWTNWNLFYRGLCKYTISTRCTPHSYIGWS